jgi:hypothetical protein
VKYRIFPAWALLAASLINVIAQQNTFVPANDVSFTISAGRNDYAIDEQIVLKYQITNISNQPLYVPRGFQATACLEHNSGPHVWGWFENSAGRHFIPGYGRSCGGTPGATPPPVIQRMNGAAILLRPGEHLDGELQLQPAMFSLLPGAYRIEAVLTGWESDKFSEAERAELERMGNPFLSGEVPASIAVNLLGVVR